ncbi:hypothetical protein FRC10_000240 [Ceratobasidium sp. 414]|nr:hypothetical protein FRC10_000240 [Ceratobasidium sp. 414]
MSDFSALQPRQPTSLSTSIANVANVANIAIITNIANIANIANVANIAVPATNDNTLAISPAKEGDPAIATPTTPACTALRPVGMPPLLQVSTIADGARSSAIVHFFWYTATASLYVPAEHISPFLPLSVALVAHRHVFGDFLAMAAKEPDNEYVLVSLLNITLCLPLAYIWPAPCVASTFDIGLCPSTVSPRLPGNFLNHKRTCLGCAKFVTLRTIRRHLKHGCDRQRRRHTQLCEAADAIIERAGRECRVRLDPPRRPAHPCRHYHRRDPPVGPPPDVLRDRLAPRKPRADVPRGSPELEHPDFQYDSSGAGPGPASRDSSPRFAPRPPRPPPTDEDDEEAQYTLRDAFPWVEELNAEEYLVNEFLSQLVRTGGHKLPPHQRFLVQAFNYKVTTDISGISYSKLRRAFPDRLGDLPSASKLCTRVGVVAGLRSTEVDCCVNSCVAFTGPYKDEEYCPHCPEPRYKPNPRFPDRRVARRVFQYIPIIPRLIALYRNLAMARKLRYRSEQPVTPGLLADIFDGDFYRQLLGRQVTVGAETIRHNFFSKPTDIALGLSTDGFGPFKSRKQSCWPLILFNYNLHPLIRTQLEHIMCVGVIPGPNAPKELTTYLEPLIAELEDLARGVPAFDMVEGQTFSLRAYLLTAFGDMPVAAKLMAMKGPNAKYPCRACKIEARGGTGRGCNTLYTPLSCPFVSGHGAIRHYNPFNLPRRSHVEHVEQAMHAEAAENDRQERLWSMATGVSGLSPLARLSSLEFPTSFPHNFMHVIFENLLPTLIQLWTKTGCWEKFGTDDEDYHLHEDTYTVTYRETGRISLFRNYCLNELIKLLFFVTNVWRRVAL